MPQVKSWVLSAGRPDDNCSMLILVIIGSIMKLAPELNDRKAKNHQTVPNMDIKS